MPPMFTRTNPRPIGSAEDVMTILRSAAQITEIIVTEIIVSDRLGGDR
jgi:hypothetical protein